MQADVVCFPAPLGCFTLPTGGESSFFPDMNEEEDYTDEYLLSDPSLAATLRAQDPPGCFLCIADTIGEEE